MSALERVKELITHRDAGWDKYRDANGDVSMRDQEGFDKVSADFEYELGQEIDSLISEIENPKLFTVIVESAVDDFPMDLVVVTVQAASEDEAEQAAIRAAEKNFMRNAERSEEELAEMKAQQSAHFDVQGMFAGRNLRMPNNSTVIDLTSEES